MAVFGSGIWAILLILGPLLLIAAIAWAMIRNRRATTGEARTEAATHTLYREQDRADKTGESQRDG